jgi:hypothetical protein
MGAACNIKEYTTAPHEIMLVVDAGTGQNAINQVQEFDQAVGLTGIFSPTPIKRIGTWVRLAILKSTPPLAVPSNLVMVIPVKPTA